ncbi:hypothetical protein HELRODRAFT_179189 [Helobdella robusta]|uniref:WSC domain-containing protein n=1 Tax=Helobdella robusta TaxID=6412 RepID=T1FEB9_HELRO|nr:hypothetical protein HELRODRAFT_179189 [Helobdella robusta]ESN95712.1 hypothetical protein HELRODRAFT_179189 [Helobdella robusta]
MKIQEYVSKILLLKIILIKSIQPKDSVFTKLSYKLKEYGNHTCVVDEPDEVFTFQKNDSQLKCASICLKTNNCIGFNYHQNNNTCQIHKNKLNINMEYGEWTSCSFYQNNFFDNINVASIEPNYLGCYADSSTPRDLSGYLIYSNELTHNSCWNVCFNQKFQYFGVQNQIGCYCGNFYGRYGLTTGCNELCSGSPSELCGGFSMSSVFRGNISLFLQM